MPRIINLVKHTDKKLDADAKAQLEQAEQQRIQALLAENEMPDHFTNAGEFTRGEVDGVFLGKSRNKLAHVFLRLIGQEQAQTNNPTAADYQKMDINSDDFKQRVFTIRAADIPPNLDIPQEIINALGDEEFQISGQEIHDLANSVKIALDSRLPAQFYQAIVADLRFSTEKYDEICNDPIESIELLKPLAEQVRNNPALYGFQNLDEANQLLAMPLHQVGNFVTLTQKHFNFLGAGNKLQAKPQHAHELLSPAGVDFQRDYEIKQYLVKNSLSPDNHNFLSDAKKEELNQRIKDIVRNMFLTSEAKGTEILSQLAVGAGAYLLKIKKPATKKAIAEMYIRNTLDLLRDNNFGLREFYFHPGQNPELIADIFEDYKDVDFPCQIYFQNTKDAGQIANEASKNDPNAATVNPSDQAVLFGHNVGKHYEGTANKFGAMYAGEEHYAGYSTYKILDSTITDAFDNLEKINVVNKETGQLEPAKKLSEDDQQAYNQDAVARAAILNQRIIMARLCKAVNVAKHAHDTHGQDDNQHKKSWLKFWSNTERQLAFSNLSNCENYFGLNEYIDSIMAYFKDSGQGRMHCGSLKPDIMEAVSRAFDFDYNFKKGHSLDNFTEHARTYKKAFYDQLEELRVAEAGPAPAAMADIAPV